MGQEGRYPFPVSPTAFEESSSSQSYIDVLSPAPREFLDPENLPDIYFDRGSYVIRKDMRAILEENAEWIKKNTNYLILIEGHTDNAGKNVRGVSRDEQNLILSDKRAKAVFDYLLAAGVHGARMTIIGYGPYRPLNFEQNEKERQQNRRVHFLIKVWN